MRYRETFNILVDLERADRRVAKFIEIIVGDGITLEHTIDMSHRVDHITLSEHGTVVGFYSRRVVFPAISRRFPRYRHQLLAIPQDGHFVRLELTLDTDV